MSDYDMRMHTDFAKMCDEIRAHCRTGEKYVLPEDDPINLNIGYKDPESKIWWQIGLVNFRRSVKALADHQQELIKAAMATEAGNIIFCSVLCGKTPEELKNIYESEEH